MANDVARQAAIPPDERSLMWWYFRSSQLRSCKAACFYDPWHGRTGDGVHGAHATRSSMPTFKKHECPSAKSVSLTSLHMLKTEIDGRERCDNVCKLGEVEKP